MCACEPGFVCSRCQGTPHDPNYVEDEPRRPSPWDAPDTSRDEGRDE